MCQIISLLGVHAERSLALASQEERELAERLRADIRQQLDNLEAESS